MLDGYDELRKGLDTAFINGRNDSNLAYKPQFISNDYEKGQKVLSSVEGELLTCSEFAISVAFITKSGITPLLQTLAELESRHIPGRVLTTDYLNFSDPEAMDKLAHLSNIELRMYRTGEDAGFHTKGYIFKNADFFHIIVGSSNMTLNALTRNKEWNAKLVSTDKGQFAGIFCMSLNLCGTMNIPLAIRISSISTELPMTYRKSRKKQQERLSETAILQTSRHLG